MATGLNDSTIRVFVLSKKQHDILTVEDLIREQVEENLKAAAEVDENMDEEKKNSSKKKK